MAIGQIFKVATEFRFEIGSAMVQTNALKSNVQQLSDAADGALLSFQRLGFGVVGSFVSGPGGGVLGVLGSAIDAQEKFRRNQIAMANAMGQGAGTFQQRMAMSAKMMEDIRKKSREFGLPASQLADFTKSMIPIVKQDMGVQAGGAAATDLGRVFLKSLPTLPISEMFGQDQLNRLLSRKNVGNNDLFDILTMETKAMRDFAGNAKAFSKLNTAERMKVLTQAFGEYGNDLESVAAMTNTLGGQMRIMRDQLTGMFSVLRPIGQVISGPVIEAMRRFNEFIGGRFARIIESVSGIMAPWVQDLDRLLATLMQLRDLSGQVSFAGKTMAVFGGLVGLDFIFQKLMIRVPYVTTGLSKFAHAIEALNKPVTMRGAAAVAQRGGVGMGRVLMTALGSIFRGTIFIAIGRFLTKIPAMGVAFIGFMGRAIGIFSKLAGFASSILAPLILFTGIMQLISRTAAYIKISYADTIGAIMERIAQIGATFSAIFSIFDDGFDSIARFLAVSPIMDFVFWGINKVLDLFERLGDGLVNLMGIFQGFVFVLAETYEYLKYKLSGGFYGSPAFEGDLTKAFMSGFDEMRKSVYDKNRDQNGNIIVPQGNTNIGNLNINNQFKENMEPDRIAYSLVEQFKKVAQSKTEAKGRTFTRGATTTAFGGN